MYISKYPACHRVVEHAEKYFLQHVRRNDFCLFARLSGSPASPSIRVVSSRLTPHLGSNAFDGRCFPRAGILPELFDGRFPPDHPSDWEG